MSSRLPLFRPEALEHHRRGPVAGLPVRLGRAWTGAAFMGLLALVGAALIAAASISVPSFVDGPAADASRGRGMVAALPVSAVTAIRDGRSAKLDNGERTVSLPRESVDVRVVDRTAAARALGRAELDIPGAEVALLRVRRRGVGSLVRAARVRVQLPEKRLLSVLLSSFQDGDG